MLWWQLFWQQQIIYKGNVLIQFKRFNITQDTKHFNWTSLMYRVCCLQDLWDSFNKDCFFVCYIKTVYCRNQNDLCVCVGVCLCIQFLSSIKYRQDFLSLYKTRTWKLGHLRLIHKNHLHQEKWFNHSTQHSVNYNILLWVHCSTFF